jgi:hypothetical protein
MPNDQASNNGDEGRAAVLDRLLKVADDASALRDRNAGVAAISAVFDAIEGDKQAVKRREN